MEQQQDRQGGFDGFAEAICKPYYATRLGAPSVPPGRYFRMHLVGYFEAINSERGLEWRCSGSLSLREFLGLESRDRVPDHSWLSKTHTHLPHEAFKLRAEIVERSFAHNLDRGGMRRTCGKRPVGSAILSNRRNA